jgi:delta 1-pyrroline-5-carboxylate dehydrogenase
MRWRAEKLDAVIGELAATGYGLSLGIHSRISHGCTSATAMSTAA